MISSPHIWGSRRGWFTVIKAPSGLCVQEINKADVKMVRLLGGVLFDLEGASEEVLARYGEIKDPKFVQYKKYRILVTPKLCACQYTGWGSHYDG